MNNRKRQPKNMNYCLKIQDMKTVIRHHYLYHKDMLLHTNKISSVLLVDMSMNKWMTMKNMITIQTQTMTKMMIMKIVKNMLIHQIKLK